MLEARFYDCMGGSISLTVKFTEEVKFVYFDVYMEEPFSGFLKWLETLVQGLDADYWWDAVNYVARLQYKKGIFTLSADDEWSVQCQIEHMDLVRIFYEAFVSFARSDEYRPRHWSGYGTHGTTVESAIKCLMTCEDMTEVFLGMDDRAVVEIRAKLNPNYRIRFFKETSNGLRRFGVCLLRPCKVCKSPVSEEEPNYIELPIAFEDWDYLKRKQWLENYWDDSYPYANWWDHQLDLRELRSSKIERVLQKDEL